MRLPLSLIVLLPLSLLNACKNGPDQKQLDASAKIYLDNGGASLSDTASRTYGRPCLDALNMDGTRLSPGALFGDKSALVAFIEQHRLATATRERQPDGSERVTLTPTAPYKSNWYTDPSGQSSFCLGFDLLKVEVVPDAKTITAGATEPYLIKGTEAIATRLTFKVTDIPGGDFLPDLEQQTTLLVRGAMRPADYGREFTVVGTVPLKPSSFLPSVIQEK